MCYFGNFFVHYQLAYFHENILKKIGVFQINLRLQLLNRQSCIKLFTSEILVSL